MEHYPRPSVMGFIRQMYGYGSTCIRLIRVGVAVDPTTLLPDLWLLSLALLIPASCFYHWAALLLALNLGLYALFAIIITLLLKVHLSTPVENGLWADLEMEVP